MSTPKVKTPTNADATPGMLAAGVDRMAAGAHSGIDAASSASAPAIARATSSAHKAVDQVDGAATQAAEMAESVGVQGSELIAAGQGYVREHPVAALGLAVAAGYVLSRLLGSR